MKYVVIKMMGITYWYSHNHTYNNYDVNNQHGEDNKYILCMDDNDYEKMQKPDFRNRMFNLSPRRPSSELKLICIDRRHKKITIVSREMDISIDKWVDATFEEEVLSKAILDGKIE